MLKLKDWNVRIRTFKYIFTHSIAIILLLGTLVSCGPRTDQIVEKKIPQAIYEVNLRHFGHNGRWEYLSKEVDRLKRMSIDAIVLPPLQPIGQKGRIGDFGSPYAISSFTHRDSSIIKRKEIIKTTVDLFNSQGISVYMDWHPLIVSPDHDWAINHPNRIKTTEVSEYLKSMFDFNYNDVVMLDLENSEVQEIMIDAMLSWVNSHSINGFRIYDAEQIPNSFYKRLKSKTKNYEDLVFIAAEDGQNHSAIFDMEMNYTLLNLLKGVYKGNKSGKDLAQYLVEQDFSPDGRKQISFTSNVYLMGTQGNDYRSLGSLNRSFAALSSLVSSSLLVTTGQEEPISIGLDLYSRKILDWVGHHNEDFWRQLILLRKRNKAILLDDTPIVLIETNNNNVLAFKKVRDGNVVVGIFNLSKEDQIIRLGEDIFGVNHYINAKEINIRKDEELKLPPTQYLILSNV